MPRTESRRPRPGRITGIMIVSAAGVAGVAAFCVLLALGRERLASVALLTLPAAGFLMRSTAIGRYLSRHVGREPASHLLVTLWAVGFAAAAVAADSPTAPVRLALATAAGGATTAAVKWVAWTRHRRGLAAKGLPDIDTSGEARANAIEDSLEWLVSLAQAATTVALVIAAPDATIALFLGGVLALYAIRASVAVGFAASRALRGDSGLRDAIDRAVTRYDPEVLVHFSGSIRTIYQLAQWMPFVASCGFRVLLVLREEETFATVAGRWPVPSVYIRDFPDLDLVVRPSVAVALYVNTGTKNNHLIRFSSIVHVQMHHGDSDKPVSSSKTMRLYDRHFVAGPAGAHRLLSAGVVSDPDAVVLVGRPQTRTIPSGALTKPRRKVVYAPTWEGFHVDAPLCSLASIGERLCREVPVDVEFVVRPHPLTGSVDRRLQRVLGSVRRALARRGEAGRYVDPSSEDLASTIADADLLIADVSSVLVDFLAADRPAIVTDVAGEGPESIHRRYPTTGWAGVLEPDLGNLGALLTDAFTEDLRRDLRREAATEFLGDVASPEADFHSALQALVGRARDQAGRGPVES